MLVRDNVGSFGKLRMTLTVLKVTRETRQDDL
jgi:hypothetical protein